MSTNSGNELAYFCVSSSISCLFSDFRILMLLMLCKMAISIERGLFRRIDVHGHALNAIRGKLVLLLVNVQADYFVWMAAFMLIANLSWTFFAQIFTDFASQRARAVLFGFLVGTCFDAFSHPRVPHLLFSAARLGLVRTGLFGIVEYSGNQKAKH
ncbi:hypothetical protein BpHYR1_050328 [Brachionus plicatilis]|uniref:Uncharacterized protein n=1 Tax=Brachionus plicatilis TaxID=10195 RepID=A0A3M7SDC3_BRAPC|nr:hypothetical protein BpHYR1_050328 [Brachionus plicatilis]